MTPATDGLETAARALPIGTEEIAISPAAEILYLGMLVSAAGVRPKTPTHYLYTFCASLGAPARMESLSALQLLRVQHGDCWPAVREDKIWRSCNENGTEVPAWR